MTNQLSTGQSFSPILSSFSLYLSNFIFQKQTIQHFHFHFASIVSSCVSHYHWDGKSIHLTNNINLSSCFVCVAISLSPVMFLFMPVPNIESDEVKKTSLCLLPYRCLLLSFHFAIFVKSETLFCCCLIVCPYTAHQQQHHPAEDGEFFVCFGKKKVIYHCFYVAAYQMKLDWKFKLSFVEWMLWITGCICQFHSELSPLYANEGKI